MNCLLLNFANAQGIRQLMNSFADAAISSICRACVNQCNVKKLNSLARAARHMHCAATQHFRKRGRNIDAPFEPFLLEDPHGHCVEQLVKCARTHHYRATQVWMGLRTAFAKALLVQYAECFFGG
jgi:hypothetical protein